VGGGGAPMVDLPSAAVALDPELAGPLRTGSPAVLGRTEDGRLLLDLRAVDPGDDDSLGAAVVAAARAAVDTTGGPTDGAAG
jgi:L-seryl-tRNA(Ser) seleniumtransferase